MKNRLSALVALLFPILLVTDSKSKPQSNLTVLLLNRDSSTIVEPQYMLDILDSISIETFHDDFVIDSMKFTRCYKSGDKTLFHLIKVEDDIYEKRYLINEADFSNYIDTLLLFSRKDTAYKHKVDEDNEFIVMVKDFSYSSCSYRLFKEGEYYVTEKKSLIDTTYKDIFYYDQNYNILKFVNTRQDIRCVYLPRE